MASRSAAFSAFSAAFASRSAARSAAFSAFSAARISFSLNSRSAGSGGGGAAATAAPFLPPPPPLLRPAAPTPLAAAAPALLPPLAGDCAAPALPAPPEAPALPAPPEAPALPAPPEAPALPAAPGGSSTLVAAAAAAAASAAGSPNPCGLGKPEPYSSVSRSEPYSTSSGWSGVVTMFQNCHSTSSGGTSKSESRLPPVYRARSSKLCACATSTAFDLDFLLEAEEESALISVSIVGSKKACLNACACRSY